MRIPGKPASLVNVPKDISSTKIHLGVKVCTNVFRLLFIRENCFESTEGSAVVRPTSHKTRQ